MHVAPSRRTSALPIGAVLAGSGAWLQVGGRERQPLVVERKLPGRHNLVNLAAAALGVAAFVGCDQAPRIARSLAGFGGLVIGLCVQTSGLGARIVRLMLQHFPSSYFGTVAALVAVACLAYLRLPDAKPSAGFATEPSRPTGSA